MITLPQLKALLKHHNIQYSYINKDEIIALLMDRQIITAEDILKPKVVAVVAKKSETLKLDADLNKYAHLKDIRTNPKAFEIYDMETNKVTVYPSMYAARRMIGISPSRIKDGKTWKGRYVISSVSK